MSGAYGSLFAFWMGGVGFTVTLPPDTPHSQLIITGPTLSAGTVSFSLVGR